MQLSLTLAPQVSAPKTKAFGRWITYENMSRPIQTYDKDGNETGWASVKYTLEELDAIGLEYPIARITVENAEALDVEDISYGLKQAYEDHDIEQLAIKNVFTDTWEFQTAIH